MRKIIFATIFLLANTACSKQVLDFTQPTQANAVEAAEEKGWINYQAADWNAVEVNLNARVLGSKNATSLGTVKKHRLLSGPRHAVWIGALNGATPGKERVLGRVYRNSDESRGWSDLPQDRAILDASEIGWENLEFSQNSRGNFLAAFWTPSHLAEPQVLRFASYNESVGWHSLFKLPLNSDQKFKGGAPIFSYYDPFVYLFDLSHRFHRMEYLSRPKDWAFSNNCIDSICSAQKIQMFSESTGLNVISLQSKKILHHRWQEKHLNSNSTIFSASSPEDLSSAFKSANVLQFSLASDTIGNSILLTLEEEVLDPQFPNQKGNILKAYSRPADSTYWVGPSQIRVPLKAGSFSYQLSKTPEQDLTQFTIKEVSRNQYLAAFSVIDYTEVKSPVSRLFVAQYEIAKGWSNVTELDSFELPENWTQGSFQELKIASNQQGKALLSALTLKTHQKAVWKTYFWEENQEGLRSDELQGECLIGYEGKFTDEMAYLSQFCQNIGIQSALFEDGRALVVYPALMEITGSPKMVGAQINPKPALIRGGLFSMEYNP